jgi:hypothetical protein
VGKNWKEWIDKQRDEKVKADLAGGTINAYFGEHR